MVRRFSTFLACLLLSLFSASLVSASSVDLMSFSGLQDGQLVGNYYNGGGGPNFGVSFSSNIYALKPVSEGGSGNFSPTLFGTPAIFISGTAGSMVTGTMNVTGGFSSGINFFYTAAFGETVTVWSGANGTGTVLATIALAANDGNCATVGYCNWTNVRLSFSGTAASVTFSGPANGIGISDMTIGQSTTAIPEPSSMLLLGTGLVGFGAQRLRRFMKA